MKKETLLEKAKKIKGKAHPKVPLTNEHLELAFAWLRNEIGLTQVNLAIGKDPHKSGNILYSIAVWLREAYRQGKLKIK